MELQRRAEIEGQAGSRGLLREGYLARETEATMREHSESEPLAQ